MAGIIQSGMDDYSERVGEIVGLVTGALLLVALIVWLIRRSRKG